MTNFFAWAENELRRGSGVGVLIFLTLLFSFGATVTGYVTLFAFGHYIIAALILPGIPALIVVAAYIWRKKE